MPARPVSSGANRPAPRDAGLRRVRLSEWAAEQGIARITAYRMLRRGILPVPSERSPTGRWYVLLPAVQSEHMAFYARASQGPDQAHALNDQIAALSEWAAFQHREVYIVVKEIAPPLTGRMPKLARLLADPHISDIVVESSRVVGEPTFQLLVSALAPQGRRITAVNSVRQSRRLFVRETRAAVLSLCRSLYGAERGLAAARRALEDPE